MAIPHDVFGPEYIIEVSNSIVGMRGFLVIDNTALGPGKGGVRMTPTVTVEEVYRLARTMTWKNALAGIPFGGAKAGIVWPEDGSVELKKQLVQSFAHAIKPLTPKHYITGPDVHTGEREMQWFVEATGIWKSATGKPSNLCTIFAGHNKACGIPHERGSTGFGVAKVTAVAAEMAGVALKGARVAIHGFGNVGTFTYQLLTEAGANVVTLSDRSASIADKNGLDSKLLYRFIKERKTLEHYPKRFHIPQEAFWAVPTDILIPASVTDVINASNKQKIKTKIIVEGGNIPMSESIEEEFVNKGVLVVPDFVANAGGVISSYAEYKGYAPKTMFQMVEEKVTTSARTVLMESIKRRKNPRAVGLTIAQKRVEEAMKKRKI